MKWSRRIGSVSGIGIYIHATFPLLLIWAALAQYQYTGTLTRAIEHILAGFHEDSPGLTGGRVVGMPTRADLVHALSTNGVDAPVELIMHR